jgi:drug/metabolite transporter (DMT)-like permease
MWRGLDRIAPGLFVLLWSSGFIAGKAGIGAAGPLHFLCLRFVVVALLLAGSAWLTRAPWPRRIPAIAHIVVAGWLIHAGYLGGVFTALRAGFGAGEVALVVGLQPLLTALLAAAWLGERVGIRRWSGLVLGLAGVVLVLWPRLHAGPAWPIALPGLPAALLALVSISAGTIYQKRFCQGMDLRSGGAIQYLSSGLLLASLIGPADAAPVWTVRFALALGWLVLVLSVGAIGLLYRLLQQGAASQVASLFYLVPPVTTLMGMACFGEHVGAVAAVGMLLVMAAVTLAA